MKHLPDWLLIRALLLSDPSAYPEDTSPADVSLHTWLLIQQRWATGAVAMSQDAIPISATIHALTLEGHDWASLLSDFPTLTATLATLSDAKIQPSTWILRETLLDLQRLSLRPYGKEPTITVTPEPIEAVETDAKPEAIEIAKEPPPGIIETEVKPDKKTTPSKKGKS